MTTTQVDYSTKDIADRCGLTTRMVNVYRAAAEDRLKCKLGYKVGRATYFRPHEVVEILKQREESAPADHSRNEPASENFSEVNQGNGAAGTAGMDALVAAGDQNAIAVGRALGMRWNSLLITSAMQTMQTGMMQMQDQFSQLHESVTVELTPSDLPSLPGNHPGTPALNPHFVSDEE
jgi:hypothetical protein